MSELLTRESDDAEIHVRNEAQRIVDLRLLRWGEIAHTPQGRERFVRGAFDGIEPEDVTLEAVGAHGAEPGVRLVGRGVALEDREDGPYASFRVSRTAAGDELLELVRDRVYRRASVVFEPVDGGSRLGRDGIIDRVRARLARVGIVERGAYASAEVLAVRSSPMTTPDPTPDPTPEPEPVPTPDPARLPGLGVARIAPDVLGRVDELRAELDRRMVALEARGAVGGEHVLARYGSFGQYVDAAYADPATAALLGRVLVNQITSENPGVIPPAWVQTIAGIVERPRPAIEALGGPRSLGAEGMELDWPYLDPALDLDTVVVKQLAEKSDIASVKVKILKGAEPIDTYAGGSDVSWQLIRRSRPAYREAYIRILLMCYARATEAAFEAALVAGAGTPLVLAATADADAVRAFLFAASSAVDDATGSPATVDLVSPTEFARLGGLPGLVAPVYGTSNVPGTSQASTLAINVSGLPVVRAPFLTGNTHIVTNGDAASWHEDGPFPVSAEDVGKLGQNVAVWGMGVAAITAPAGVVISTLVAGDPQSRSRK